MSEESLKEEEWKEWLTHPITKEFFGTLREWRQHLMEAWARGQFTKQEGDGTVQLNAEAIGKVLMLEEILDMDQEDLRDE